MFIGGFRLTTTTKNRLYNYNSVLSLEYELRKREVRSVTEEEMKGGDRIKTIYEPNVTQADDL